MRAFLADSIPKLMLAAFTGFLSPIVYRWIIFWMVKERPAYRKLLLPAVLGAEAGILATVLAGLGYGRIHSVFYMPPGDGITSILMVCGIICGLWLFQSRFLEKRLSLLRLAGITALALGCLYLIFLLVAAITVHFAGGSLSE